MSIILENQTDFPLILESLESIADTLTNREIELIICDNRTIEEINTAYRSKPAPTDVLSFPLEGDFAMQPLGSIIISSEMAYQKANELGHTPQEECSLLFIHGLLHLLGYDHETDNGEMRRREEYLIKNFHLPKSLIIRTEEGKAGQ